MGSTQREIAPRSHGPETKNIECSTATSKRKIERAYITEIIYFQIIMLKNDIGKHLIKIMTCSINQELTHNMFIIQEKQAYQIELN